jgi:hypothetical protein
MTTLLGGHPFQISWKQRVNTGPVKNFHPVSLGALLPTLSSTAQHLAMVTSGTKRSSPGAYAEKEFMNVELSDEDAQKLQAVQKDIARVELLLGEYRFHFEARMVWD